MDLMAGTTIQSIVKIMANANCPNAKGNTNVSAIATA